MQHIKQTLKNVVVAILTFEAKLVLKKYRPKVVAVTGSVGKTSTKDTIYTMLSHGRFVRKSEKSYNSELGVPLTILGLPTAWRSVRGWAENIFEGLHLIFTRASYPEWLVLEVGADRVGDIRKLHWIAPRIVVYTRFPDVPVHVEYFDTPDAVMQEKRELAKALLPNGVLIVNADDEKMRHEHVSEGQDIISYGFAQDATVRAGEVTVFYDGEYPAGVTTTVSFQAETLPLQVRGTLGVHQVYPLLAALAVGVAEGVTFSRAVEALRDHVPPAGRMRVLKGVHGCTIIDDTYNASPVAVEAGLSALSALKTKGRKIVVLGDMMELGDFSVDAHKQVGEHVGHVADIFVAVGVRMRNAAHVAKKLKMCNEVKEFHTVTESISFIKEMLQEGDTVYVKGSQSMRMEKLVEEILIEPAAAPNLLVRQEREWKER